MRAAHPACPGRLQTPQMWSAETRSVALSSHCQLCWVQPCNVPHPELAPAPPYTQVGMEPFVYQKHAIDKMHAQTFVVHTWQASPSAWELEMLQGSRLQQSGPDSWPGGRPQPARRSAPRWRTAAASSEAAAQADLLARESPSGGHCGGCREGCRQGGCLTAVARRAGCLVSWCWVIGRCSLAVQLTLWPLVAGRRQGPLFSSCRRVCGICAGRRSCDPVRRSRCMRCLLLLFKNIM